MNCPYEKHCIIVGAGYLDQHHWCPRCQEHCDWPRPQSVGAETAPLRETTLGQMIGYFKYQSTKQINLLQQTPGISVWQRNYYEHIIRDENDLNKIREYIAYNPLQWDWDQENPNRLA